MKKITFSLICCILLVIAALLSCELFGWWDVENSIYGKAKKVAPEFLPAARSTPSRTWTTGDVIYELFNALREFESPRDEGVVDRSNLYKMLYDTSALWSGLKNRGNALPSTRVIVPPFNFGNNFSYSYANNLTNEERGIAYSNSDTAIISWIWREPPAKREIGVLEMTPLYGAGTIYLDFIFCVDYNSATDETDYNMRSHLEGNLTTHEFQYRSIRGSATAENINMVGKGISEGAGNYFLFKIRAGSSGTVYYIVFPTSADETTLQAMNIATDGYTDPNLLPASVAAYKDYVVNTPFYTFSEMPSNVNALNVGNAKAGTIYLDY